MEYSGFFQFASGIASSLTTPKDKENNFSFVCGRTFCFLIELSRLENKLCFERKRNHIGNKIRREMEAIETIQNDSLSDFIISKSFENISLAIFLAFFFIFVLLHILSSFFFFSVFLLSQQQLCYQDMFYCFFFRRT